MENPYSLRGVRVYNDAFVKHKNLDQVINITTKYTSLKDKKLWGQLDIAGLNPDGKMYVSNIKKQYEWYKSQGAIQGRLTLRCY